MGGPELPHSQCIRVSYAFKACFFMPYIFPAQKIHGAGVFCQCLFWKVIFLQYSRAV